MFEIEMILQDQNQTLYAWRATGGGRNWPGPPQVDGHSSSTSTRVGIEFGFGDLPKLIPTPSSTAQHVEFSTQEKQ